QEGQRPLPGLEAACERARSAPARRLHPWLQRRHDRQAQGAADRTEVFRGRARDQARRPCFEAWPARVLRQPRAADGPQWPRHYHRLDPAGRAFGQRSARAERRWRSAGGGVLMSRIGKRPVEIPGGVTAAIENGTLSVKGPKGTLTLGLSDKVSYKLEDGSISIEPANDSKEARSHW